MKYAKTFGLFFAGMVALGLPLAQQSFAECYVKVAPRPVHRSYIRRDVVEPGVYEVHRRPPLHGWVVSGYYPRRVLLRPYKNIARFQRPYVAWSREHVLVQPEGGRWVSIDKPDC